MNPSGNRYYCLLEQESLLHISGEQALDFLQGQITCDTRTLDATRALPGLYCNVQGRVVCDFLLCQLGPEHYALRLRRDIRASSAALLARYIVFSKAHLDAADDDWQLLACWGDDVGPVLQNCLGALPAEKYTSCTGDNFVLLQVDDDGCQFECYINSAREPALLEQLQDGLQMGSESHWQAMQIGNGVARIEASTSGEFIPQLLNYDLTGHISFNKGCYTGQEVVARMHYRGKPKRRLHLASLDASQPAVAGCPLYPSMEQTIGEPQGDAPDPASIPGKSVGNVINCARAADQQLWVLLTATRDGISAGLHLDDPTGAPLVLAELPYPNPEK